MSEGVHTKTTINATKKTRSCGPKTSEILNYGDKYKATLAIPLYFYLQKG